MKKLCVSLLALTVAVLPMRALAWGEMGHRTVAAIAWAYMTPKARAKPSPECSRPSASSPRSAGGSMPLAVETTISVVPDSPCRPPSARC